ncbi:hypothetical protein L1987_24504 [Smallanthus sonchifolius]|uniref:Uncharacterized protein n=1 Tax=Smallanthus sonchifolius TaxID=185202 RepID=A0ACB9IL78_9ASTR|nr:hypothetical protein L1987_24504 [Smallanthus sonchifolius]
MCDDGPLSSLARASFGLHCSLTEELDGPRSYGYRPLTTLTIFVGESELPSKSPVLPSWVDGQVVTAKVEGLTVEKVDRSGVIGGDAVVLALGPWTSKLPELSSKVRVYGDVYICGPSVEVEIPDEPESVVPDLESIQMLKSVAGIVSSYLAKDNVTVKSEEAGLMPCTDVELPVMGEVPGMKQCYVASGHGYWGILFGPASGVAMAELVLDGHATIVDLDCFSPARFASKKV